MKKISYYITILRIHVLRLLNPKATHTFWYSKDQADSGFDFYEYQPKAEVYFKKKRYTEMREFKYGLTISWPDAVFVGIGTYADVKHVYPLQF